MSAKYDLDGTTHLAPANGRVANLALRPGVRATQFATMPVMSFIEEDDPWVLAFFRQNELRYVEPGNEAEIFMEMYPGRIIKCKVDSILWATAQGQMPISGNLPNHRCRAPRRNSASPCACSSTARTRTFSLPPARAAMARSTPST